MRLHKRNLSAVAFVGFRFSVCSVALATLALGQQVLAQTTGGGQPQDAAAAADNNGITDIIVTAQKRSERLQDVPISISAATADTLQRTGTPNTQDLPQITSGLINATGFTGNTGLTPIIRGVGSAVSLAGIESSVALYMDGVYSAAKTANTLDIVNIERIEVLKGPQGTLYGRNATGGAINIITKAPSDHLEGEASVGYGRFNESVERGYISGPLTSTLRAGVSIVARQGGDYATNLFDGKKFGGLTSAAINGQLLWEPTDRFNVRASVGYDRRKSRQEDVQFAAAPGFPPLGSLAGGLYSTNPNFGDLNNAPVSNTYTTRASVNAHYSLDAFSIVSITAYEHGKTHYMYDADGTTAPILVYNLHGSSKTFSQELQLVSDSKGPFQWILGGYYFYFSEPYDPFNVIVAPTPVNYNTDPTSRAGSVFGQATYEFARDTRITAGLRYNIEKRGLTGDLTAPALSNAVIGGPVDLSKTFRKLTWRLSIDHKFDANTMIYASYNRGFKSGAFNSSSVDPNQKPIAPEVLDAYEVGMKAQLFDRLVQINGAIYYYDYKNIQVFRTTFASNSLSVLEAAGAAKLYGFDGDIVITPMTGVRLNGGINLEHSKYTRYDNASAFDISSGIPVTTTVDEKGQQVLGAPNVTFNAGASYTMPLGDNDKITPALNYSYNSHYKLQAGEGNDVRAFGILNASVRWENGHSGVYVEAWGRNLTNVRRYGTYASAFGVFSQVRAPISYGLTAGIKF